MKAENTITRREALRRIAAGATLPLLGQLAWAAPVEQKPSRRPNFLLFITDDQGYDALGCAGNAVIKTPNFDALASRGARLANAYVTAPSCSPSRASILTGRYPHVNGMLGLANGGWSLPQREVLVPAMLKRAGYKTVGFGKFHLGVVPEEKGFDKWIHQRGHPKAANNAVKFLQQHDGSPFFMVVSTHEPHRWFTRGYQPPYDPKKVPVPPYLPDVPAVRKDLANYYGAVSLADRAFGMVFEALKKRGWDENTMIIFVGDNGMPFPRAKCTLYDSGVKAPMIISWPGRIKAGIVPRQLVSTVDLVPTILEAASLQPPNNLNGRSILPLLEGKAYKPAEYLYTEKTYHIQYDPMRGVRDERFKYIYSFEHEKLHRLEMPSDLSRSPTGKALGDMYNGPRQEQELYDLENDPYEMKDLASDPKHAGKLAALKKQLFEFLKQTDDPILKGHIPRPPRRKRRLKYL